MTHNHCLAKRLPDAAWSQFIALLAYKAAWAGRQFVVVTPAYTSHACSGCGHRQPLSLSDRTYTCPCCEVVLERDLNASLNMLRVGQHALASAQPWPTSSRIYLGELSQPPVACACRSRHDGKATGKSPERFAIDAP
jgi:putative transposase